MTTTQSVLQRRLRRFRNILLSLAMVTSLHAAEKIVWKPMERASLKINDKPQKIWNVYHMEKREPVLLVQIWRRYLLVNYRDREIYDIEPSKLERKDKDLLWSEADKPAKPVPTEDWLVRDVGPLKRIRVKLSAEDRVLEVQIPIERDMRPFY